MGNPIKHAEHVEPASEGLVCPSGLTQPHTAEMCGTPHIFREDLNQVDDGISEEDEERWVDE